MGYFTSWNYVEETEIAMAVTGWNTSAWEPMKVGERVTTMAGAFDVREGFPRSDDWLPERFSHHRLLVLCSKPLFTEVNLRRQEIHATK